MKRLLFLISFMLCAAFAMAQENPLIENGKPYDKTKIKPFLAELHDKNDYVLTFRTLNANYPESSYDYLVLTKKGASLSAYNYSQSSQKLNPLSIPADSMKLLWKAYTDFNIFKIRDEKENFIFCPDKYLIPNMYTYEIVMLSKDSMKILSYQDAEYYHRVCTGMTARKNIIDCANLLHYVVNSVIVEPVKIIAF